jgi:multisubunit Na+/H+ antiporter MnhC subunit
MDYKKLLMSIICLIVGLWIASINLDLMIDGMGKFGEKTSLDLNRRIATAFVVSEFVAMVLAGIMIGMAWRKRMLGYAWAVVVLELCFVGGVQWASNVSVTKAARASVENIAALEAQAVAARSATAARAAAVKKAVDIAKTSYEISLTKKMDAALLVSEATTAAIELRLEAARGAVKTSLADGVGDVASDILTGARGLLMGVGGVIFSGAAGSLFGGALRGGVPSTQRTGGFSVWLRRWRESAGGAGDGAGDGVGAGAVSGDGGNEKGDRGNVGGVAVRYEAILCDVKGGLKPSVRSIQTVHGGGSKTIGDCLRRMESEGWIRKVGLGYELVK